MSDIVMTEGLLSRVFKPKKANNTPATNEDKLAKMKEVINKQNKVNNSVDDTLSKMNAKFGLKTESITLKDSMDKIDSYLLTLESSGSGYYVLFHRLMGGKTNAKDWNGSPEQLKYEKEGKKILSICGKKLTPIEQDLKKPIDNYAYFKAGPYNKMMASIVSNKLKGIGISSKIEISE
jgi:hypothetical protein